MATAALLLASAWFLYPSALSAEQITFNAASVLPTPFRIKQAKKQGIEFKAKPGWRLTGKLSKPEGNGPFPAVVLLHGCRGMKPYQDDWAAKLTNWGYVTLRVDSFGPRGIKETCTNPTKAAYYYGVSGGRIMDAYGALFYLGSQPFVDKDRVAVVGWAPNPVLGTVVRAGSDHYFDQRFQAAVAFYPHCKRVTSGDFYAPILVFSGGKDDWEPAKYCERMATAGAELAVPITLKVYPDAYHSFDDPSVGELWYFKGARNYEKSPARGATLGYNRAAHEDAIKQVKEFLATHLK